MDQEEFDRLVQESLRLNGTGRKKEARALLDAAVTAFDMSRTLKFLSADTWIDGRPVGHHTAFMVRRS